MRLGGGRVVSRVERGLELGLEVGGLLVGGLQRRIDHADRRAHGPLFGELGPLGVLHRELLGLLGRVALRGELGAKLLGAGVGPCSPFFGSSASRSTTTGS